jgi:hypothetical protein
LKIRLAIISAMLAVFGIVGAAPASAGLWCENVDTVDESAETGGLAGGACRLAVGVVCSVVSKGSGGGCLA